MVDHAKFVWKKYIMDSKHDELYIIAHSAGGSCLGAIQNKFNKKQKSQTTDKCFYDRVR